MGMLTGSVFATFLGPLEWWAWCGPHQPHPPSYATAAGRLGNVLSVEVVPTMGSMKNYGRII